MSIIRSFEKIPTKIREAIQRDGFDPGQFLCALKTACKPNPGIPFLWLLATTKGYLLCSTGKGLWLDLRKGNLDSISVNTTIIDGLQLEIVWKDTSKSNFILPLISGENIDDVNEILKYQKDNK
jgi:hypothetical protein